MGNEYKVLRITQMSRISDEGGIEHYYRHRIKTKGGIVLDVNVERKDFTPELTAPILQKEAQNADKIKAL